MFYFQLFDISTTVDPSYVISLIRKLLPTNLTGDQELRTENSGENVASMSKDGVPRPSENVAESIGVVEDFQELAHGESASDETFRQGVEQPGHNKLVGEEAWEEYGCVLWDLASSKTHAELMVYGFFFFCLFNFNLVVRNCQKKKQKNN